MGQIQNRYRREAMALRSIDEHAHFTRADLATLLTRTIVSDARAAARQGALRSELPSILRFRFNQLVGAYRGFNGPSELSAELRYRFYYPGVNGSRMTSPAQDQHRIDYEALEAEQSLGRGSSQGGSR